MSHVKLDKATITILLNSLQKGDLFHIVSLGAVSIANIVSLGMNDKLVCD